MQITALMIVGILFFAPSAWAFDSEGCKDALYKLRGAVTHTDGLVPDVVAKEQKATDARQAADDCAAADPNSNCSAANDFATEAEQELAEVSETLAALVEQLQTLAAGVAGGCK